MMLCQDSELSDGRGKGDVYPCSVSLWAGMRLTSLEHFCDLASTAESDEMKNTPDTAGGHRSAGKRWCCRGP